MEHLNRECKGSIGGLGENITDTAVQRVGKSLRSSTRILETFDQEIGLQLQSGHHTKHSSEGYMSKLLKQIHQDTNVFTDIPGREHRNSQTLRTILLETLPNYSGFRIATRN